MLAFCRAEYGAVASLARRVGRGGERCSRRPSRTSRCRGRPGSARRSPGLPSSAGARDGLPRLPALLERAGGRRALLCRARLALDRGDGLRAGELAERALRDIPADRALDRAPALEVLAHARIAVASWTRRFRARGAPRAPRRRRHRPTPRRRRYGRGSVSRGARRSRAGAHAARGRGRRLRAERASVRDGRARIELATLLVASGRTADGGRGADRGARDALVGLGAAAEAARAERLLAAYAGQGASGRGAAVTPREREVLALVAEGLTNRQIAARLVVSEHTVHRHVTNILRKLDLPTPRGGRGVRRARRARRAPSRLAARNGRSWRCRRDGHALASAVERSRTRRETDERASQRRQTRRRWRGRCGRSATTTASRARLVWEVGPVLVDACGIAAGQRVLDVAAGTGNVAIRAAERGADVVASDLTPENFAAGRARRPSRRRARVGRGGRGGAPVRAMRRSTSSRRRSGRCSRPITRRSPSELLRVCRPGGTIGLASFTPDGTGGGVLRASSPAHAPPPPPRRRPPVLWGDEEHVRSLFGDRVASLDLSAGRTSSGRRARRPTARLVRGDVRAR